MYIQDMHWSVVNIPYPLKVMEYILQMYNNNVIQGLLGLKAHCANGMAISCIVSDLIATRFHPDQIVHSLSALFFNCKHILPPEAWDSDVRQHVQDIIVGISKHNTDYSDTSEWEWRLVRTTSANPSGFYVFHCGDKEMEGLYVITTELFDGLPVFVTKNGSRLFRQVGFETAFDVDSSGSLHVDPAEEGRQFGSVLHAFDRGYSSSIQLVVSEWHESS